MKWLKRLSISLAIALFAVCCGAVLLFNWGGFGFKALTVPTGSMRPHIPPGSLVLMHRVPYSTLRVGDVITYTNPLNVHSSVTHRIVSINSSGKVPIYITKGDANQSADPIKVIAGQVQGRAVWHAPHIGSVLSWSKTWLGIAVLVYLPAALIMWGAALDMSDHMRKFQLYELKLFPKTRRRFHLALGRRTGAATILLTLFILILGAVAVPVSALLRSNTVKLSPNTLTVRRVTPPPPPPPACTTGGNSTTVSVTNTGTGGSSSNNTSVNNSSQTATSGNATNSNNSNGGNATSGNATNTNCTVITVTNTNH